MTDHLREREVLDISSVGETIHMKKCKKHGTKSLDFNTTVLNLRSPIGI